HKWLQKKWFFITWFSSSTHLKVFQFWIWYAGFSDLEEFWDELPVSRLKYNALEDFQDDLPGSLLTESSHMSPFHNRSERFGKF
uniref:Uncharacterized protein n=1 Tax=Brassica oleracea var. oleracea TaxID=109376 RepID=A0A0D3BU61_BRAOL